VIGPTLPYGEQSNHRGALDEDCKQGNGPEEFESERTGGSEYSETRSAGKGRSLNEVAVLGQARPIAREPKNAPPRIIGDLATLGSYASVGRSQRPPESLVDNSTNENDRRYTPASTPSISEQINIDVRDFVASAPTLSSHAEDAPSVEIEEQPCAEVSANHPNPGYNPYGNSTSAQENLQLPGAGSEFHILEVNTKPFHWTDERAKPSLDQMTAFVTESENGGGLPVVPGISDGHGSSYYVRSLNGVLQADSTRTDSHITLEASQRGPLIDNPVVNGLAQQSLIRGVSEMPPAEEGLPRPSRSVNDILEFAESTLVDDETPFSINLPMISDSPNSDRGVQSDTTKVKDNETPTALLVPVLEEKFDDTDIRSLISEGDDGVLQVSRPLPTWDLETENAIVSVLAKGSILTPL
jgi:hypothetical protein